MKKQYLDLYSPLTTDKDLYFKLWLTTELANHGEETFLGKVYDEEGWIDIYTLLLCQLTFFKFVIYCAETADITVIETGSGSLKEYYPIAEKVKNGMVVLKHHAND